MNAIGKRLDRLESQAQANSVRFGRSMPDRPTVRLVISAVGSGRPNLAESTCTRYVANGKLIEMVNMAGEPSLLRPEQLEEFIGRFSIQRI